MDSSKKKKGEEEKKTKETKTKAKTPEKKKETNTKTKPKATSKKQKTNKISNGAVSDSKDVASPTSNNDSQQKQPHKKRSLEPIKNKRSESKKPKKSGKKQELDDEEEKEDMKYSVFPMSRIKRIMKSQGCDSALTGDAVFLVNKATEKFLEQFSEDAYACCVKDRKKSVAYKHLASVVSKQMRYEFLSGVRIILPTI
ncbi:uncharacterized protein LOC123207377 isoform X2 [Mangifera indica]|uniref:uncharacterized protein LOC123207377 isoform X2 n=1 Tax=Mangifera indica TaxID=29780 RepID=UPI001CFA166E|nr:uncharacterized protein LOC123207377 isoform X2 [Mangifera indica]